MYAIIESCGRQYKVAEGDVVFFEKLDAEEGKKITFDNVILVSEEGKVQIGNPYVKGVKGQFGLGLSIVSKIADMYGYDIHAENKDTGVAFIFTKRAS